MYVSCFHNSADLSAFPAPINRRRIVGFLDQFEAFRADVERLMQRNRELESDLRLCRGGGGGGADSTLSSEGAQDTDTHTDAHSYTGTDTHTDIHTHTHTDTDTDAHTYTDTDLDSDTELSDVTEAEGGDEGWWAQRDEL